VRRASSARSVMSPKLPIGVGTRMIRPMDSDEAIRASWFEAAGGGAPPPPPPGISEGVPPGVPEGARTGPASLAPDIDASVRSRPAPVYESRPTTIVPPPNEVVVPLNGRLAPLVTEGGGAQVQPVPSPSSSEPAGAAPSRRTD